MGANVATVHECSIHHIYSIIQCKTDNEIHKYILYL